MRPRLVFWDPGKEDFEALVKVSNCPLFFHRRYAQYKKCLIAATKTAHSVGFEPFLCTYTCEALMVDIKPGIGLLEIRTRIGGALLMQGFCSVTGPPTYIIPPWQT